MVKLANPPSICFRNTSNCGQGLVPVLAVNATEVAHVQVQSYCQASVLKLVLSFAKSKKI